jgi:hypothetical protein
LQAAKPVESGVTLHRGSASRAEVPAIRAWNANRLLTDPDGLLITATPYDYLIATDEYRVTDTLLEPQPGDRIVESLGTFEVIAPPGSACFHLREDGLYRIHTQKIA